MRRAASADRGAGVQPDAASEHGYEPVGSVLETNTDDLPFLVDSVTGGARRARPRHRARAAPDRRHRARGAAGASAPSATRAAPRTRVGHALRARPPAGADEELARARGRGPRGARATSARVVRRLPGDARARRRIDAARRAPGRRATSADEVEEVVAFLALAAARRLHLPRRPRVRLRRRAITLVPGSGLGILADEARSTCARAASRSTSCPATCASTRSTATCCWSPRPTRSRPCTGASGWTTSASGASARTARSSAVAAARPLHDQGLRRAGRARPRCCGRKLRQILDGRGPDRGLARLQGRGRAVRLLPQGRAVRRAASRTCAARVARAARARRATAVRLLGAPRRRRAQRVADRRAARARATTPRCVERAARRCSAARFGAADGRDPRGARRRRARRASHFARPRAAGELPDARRCATLEQRGRRAHAHLGRPAARALDRPPRRRARPACSPRAGRARCPSPTRPRPTRRLGRRTTSTRFERLRGRGEGLVVSGCRTSGEARTRVALYKRGRQGRALRGDADARGPRPARDRGAPDAARRGAPDETWVQDFGVLGPDDAPLDLDARAATRVADVHRRRLARRRRVRLAEPAGRRGRPRLAPGRRSCAPTASTASAIGSRFTEGYQNDVHRRPTRALTAKLMRLFELRFDPARARDEAAEAALREEILADLDDVASLDHDRILRNQLGLIDATVRTNAYRPGRERDRLQAALRRRARRSRSRRRCSRSTSTRPRWRASTCAAARSPAAGCAGRTGMDYRTEVYGLMRAQMTKNAVIVPDGRQGRLLPQAPAGRPRRAARRGRAPVRRATSRGAARRHRQPRRRRGRAPAGRARARRRRHLPRRRRRQGHRDVLRHRQRASPQRDGFWLGDAFASGGSAGYDHKTLGITARGAWESVKRHFRELDLDPAVDEFTVVGIGDMSGDVFGNGMLLSRPDPARRRLRPPARLHRPRPRTPAASFAERKRLFELARLLVGRLRPRADLRGRRRLAAHARSRSRCRRRRAPRSGSRTSALAPDRPDPRDPARAGRPAVERRHRHGRQGLRRDRRRRAGPLVATRSASTRATCAAGSSARAATSASRSARASSSPRGGGLHQRRLHRQLRRRRLLRPRGQPEDPARARGQRAASSTRAERDELLRGGHRRRRRARPLRLVPAGADPRPGGRGAPPARLYAYEDLMGAARGGRARSTARRRRCPAPRRWPSAGARAAGWSGPSSRCCSPTPSARSTDALLRVDAARRPVARARPARLLPAARSSSASAHLLAEHPLRRELLATLVGQPRRQRARADVRLAAGRRARRDAGRGRARLPDRARGDRRGGALGRDRGARRGVEPEVAGELMDGVDWLVEAATRWYLANAARAATSRRSIAGGREGFERLTAALPELGDGGAAAEREADRRRPADAAPACRTSSPEAHALRPALAHAPDVVAVAAAHRPRASRTSAGPSSPSATELRLDWLEHAARRAARGDADAALGAPGGARRLPPGAPRAGPARAARSPPGAARPRRSSASSHAPRRGRAAARRVPARAVARGRAGPRRARRSPCASCAASWAERIRARARTASPSARDAQRARPPHQRPR